MFRKITTLVTTYSTARTDDGQRPASLLRVIKASLDNLSTVLQDLETFIDPWSCAWARVEDGTWEERHAELDERQPRQFECL